MKNNSCEFFFLRKKQIVKILCLLLFLLVFFLIQFFLDGKSIEANFSEKNLSPSFQHPFGTDWLGRDMLLRTFIGLGISFKVGIFAALLSTALALIFSILAAGHKVFDAFVTGLIDIFLSIPNLLLVILIVFAFGGGPTGVILAIGFTHWPKLTRLLRAEIMQVKTAPYVQISGKMGKSPVWIVKEHFLPQLMPQLLVGFTLLFPHAVLHEAAISFLGFGLPPEQPAIGTILSESMQYFVTGMWWLAFFPGCLLVLFVIIVNQLGKLLVQLFFPSESLS